MKIAQILRPNDQAPEEKYGGCGRVVTHLIEGLIERNHDVTLYTAKPSTLDCNIIYPKEGIIQEKTENDIGSHRWAGYIAQVMDHIRSLEKKGQGYDIVNNHYDPIAFVLGQNLKTPMLTTTHGTANDANLRSFSIYPDSYFSAISQSQRDQYPEDMNFLGYAYNSMDTNHVFSKIKGNYLFSVGRIMPAKGQENALEIARRSGLNLVLAGPVSDKHYFNTVIRPKVKDLSAEKKSFIENIRTYNPSGGKAIYLGELSGVERDKVMQHAKAFLFPIEWPEPFGLVMIEAGMTGTPVIASRRGAVPEIVEQGKTGFYGEGIDELVSFTKKVDKIVPQQCRDHVMQKFSVDKMVDKYLEIYEMTLAIHNGHRIGARGLMEPSKALIETVNKFV